jgi:superfamily II DNA or RNA helicase/HKD family nuclease
MVRHDALRAEIRRSSETALIDGSTVSECTYRPLLLRNDRRLRTKVAPAILAELDRCTRFDFSVAFVTRGGLALLSLKLDELREKGVKGRLITTDYLDFNDPEALSWLLHRTDVEVRMHSGEGFHTKGYIFGNRDFGTLIIGSSNLTQGALTVNREWNLKISSLEDGELYRDTTADFERMWEQAVPLTDAWIEAYRPRHLRASVRRDRELFDRARHGIVVPNGMQEEALARLDTMRREGRDRALLISATGTGKTYLSAFDVKRSGASRVLFLVHREQILDAALESYRRILGSGPSYGKLSGSAKDFGADILFSTIHSMSREENLARFAPGHFDYVVCDEAHHAAARMYATIIERFAPGFMLGMTATPERMDRADIFKVFDYNIAYELRLQKAMEMDMLCPFHYYGISDIVVDGRTLDDGDAGDFRLLASDERVRHIVDRAEYFSFSGDRVRGLIFCSSVAEAELLSEKLNSLPGRDYRTLALSADDGMEVREDAVRRLELEDGDDRLDYIITRDVFNEGVDIPAVNQVLMLRPTQSATVFIQQLGRGLRKRRGKEHLVVIDFIGNYLGNFMIPLALSGDRTLNKDNVRRYVISGNDIIPGASSINFDRISRERIYNSIESSKLDSMAGMRKEYGEMRMRLGRPPRLTDLYRGGSLDPRVLVQRHRSLRAFERRIGVADGGFGEEGDRVLEFISRNLLDGIRSQELEVLDLLIGHGRASTADIPGDPATVASAVAVLQGGFHRDGEMLVDVVDGELSCSGLLSRCLDDGDLRGYIADAVACGLEINRQEYAETDSLGFVPYRKYSRRDACRILNWEADESSTVYGYRIKHGSCPIFVTYDKADHISDSTKYDEDFIDRSTFGWMTKSNRDLDSRDVRQILGHRETGLKLPLFMKKSDGEGTDFYYLGQAAPLQDRAVQTEISGLPVVSMPLRLGLPVRQDIYDYLVS